MVDNGMDRRDFMKSAAAGFGGFFFLSANEMKPDETTKRNSKEQTLIYRTLGKTGIKLPAINMGVMNSSNPNLVRAALNAGMVLLDTAAGYQRGTNFAVTSLDIIKYLTRVLALGYLHIRFPQYLLRGNENEKASDDRLCEARGIKNGQAMDLPDKPRVGSAFCG